MFFKKDSSEMTKDAQKKSKRKGRNRQEFVTLNKIEAEPETVKTPIDERRVSTSLMKHLFFDFSFDGGNL